MKSVRQMLSSGELKRADALKIKLEDLHEEPGFNLRDTSAQDFEEELDALCEHIAAGGIVPPLEVRPRDEGGVWIVDGHRRTLAYRKLDAAGRLPRDPKTGEARVSVVIFEGNDADRTARIMSSQNNRKLTDLERAEGCRRLKAFGWSNEQIGKSIGLSGARVGQLLSLLLNGNADVHQLVKDGSVSATMATQAVKEHGDKAGEILGAAVATAKAAGKTKATAKAISTGPTKAQLMEVWGLAKKVCDPTTSEQEFARDLNALRAAINGQK